MDKQDSYAAAVVHVLLICGILGAGQLYETSYSNYRHRLGIESLKNLKTPFLNKQYKEPVANNDKSKNGQVTSRVNTNSSIKSLKIGKDTNFQK